MSEMTPREIVHELDRHIIGQAAAKRAVAIALRNRWRRMQVHPELRTEITPKNILMIGPTGVGKTEIARRLAKLANAPFIKVEATKFTEVGYVGRDVESIVRDLAETAVKLLREQEMARVEPRALDAARVGRHHDDLAQVARQLTLAEVVHQQRDGGATQEREERRDARVPRVGEVVGVDARPAVLDLGERNPGQPAAADRDPPAHGRVANRVVDQVRQHFAQLPARSRHLKPDRFGTQVLASRQRRIDMHRNHLVDQIGDLHLLRIGGIAGGLVGPAQREQLMDQMRQPIDRMLRRGQALLEGARLLREFITGRVGSYSATFSIYAADEQLQLAAEALTLYEVDEIGLDVVEEPLICLLYTSPSPRDGLLSRMPSSA